MTYRVAVQMHTYQSREPYNDGWDRGDTDGYLCGVKIVSPDKYGWGYGDYETEIEPPFYVVYAGYYTGNTFGRDFDSCVVGVTKTRPEAEALAAEAEAFEGFGELSNGFYVPWNGYFESLSSVEVEGIM